VAAVNTQLPSPGPGYYSYHPGPGLQRQFGLPETIRVLQLIGARWQRAHPNGPRIGIGDISKRGGGPLHGHASHRLGVDVDVRPLRNDGREADVTYKSPAYSRALTQELVNLIRSNAVLRVKYIFFNDPSVMDVTRWPNHDDHLHVRFFPPGTPAVPTPVRQPVVKPAAPTAVCKPTGLTAPETTVVALTSRLETGAPFRFVVSSVDGISVGMLQWNLLAGTLQRLLHAFERSGGRLQDYFGADTDRLRRLIGLQRKVQAVKEATAEHLASRWQPAFMRLAANVRFCELMTRDVRARLHTAEEAASKLGVTTVRGLSMMFDVANGDGLSPRKVQTFAARLAARGAAAGRPLTEREQLVEIANAAADLVRKPSLREERRARRLLIAHGSGRYRRSHWDLNKEFTTLDERWR
jgi:hypothetical protein